MHDNVVRKNKMTEERHMKNLDDLNERNEQIRKENEEKQFKKYAAMYWSRKEKEKYFKKRKADNKNKEQEKQERLEELDKKREKEKRALIKKMQEIEKKKEINDKIKADEFEKLKKRRLNNIERTRENLQAIAEDDEAFRLDILEYQTMILNRGVTKDNVTNMKRLNANDKTIINQMNIEKNLKNFRKKMFQLKD